MLSHSEVTAASLLHQGNPTAGGIVAAKIRNALQPILLCAESVDDAEAMMGVSDLLGIADLLRGHP